MSEEVITKGEFAQLIGVTPGRVSQMIAAGQIGPEAIEGQGRSAKIRSEIAKEQLRRRLDIGQRLGNGLGTRLSSDSGAAAPAAAFMPAAAPRQPDRSELFDDAIRAERLRSLRFANRRAAEEEQERRGVYVRADQVEAAMTKVAAAIVDAYEGKTGDLSQAIAAKFQLPARDVQHLVSALMREIRAKAAAAMRQHAESLPAFLQDDVADATDPAKGEA